jgi:hypothetical protein
MRIKMNEKSKIRMWLYVFIVGLLLSGITAFPLEWELGLLNTFIGVGSSVENHLPALSSWISHVHLGIVETNRNFPFIAYGTDWLAFAHIILAILFIGPLKDPVKNIWVIEFAIIACILIIPLALVCGSIRGIPVFWRLIDCSFGVFGIIPLLIVRKKIKALSK